MSGKIRNLTGETQMMSDVQTKTLGNEYFFWQRVGNSGNPFLSVVGVKTLPNAFGDVSVDLYVPPDPTKDRLETLVVDKTANTKYLHPLDGQLLLWRRTNKTGNEYVSQVKVIGFDPTTCRVKVTCEYCPHPARESYPASECHRVLPLFLYKKYQVSVHGTHRIPVRPTPQQTTGVHASRTPDSRELTSPNNANDLARKLGELQSDVSGLADVLLNLIQQTNGQNGNGIVITPEQTQYLEEVAGALTSGVST